MPIITEPLDNDKNYPFQAIIISTEQGLVKKSPIQYVNLYRDRPALRVWGNAQRFDDFNAALDAKVSSANGLEELAVSLEADYCVLRTKNAEKLRKEIGVE